MAKKKEEDTKSSKTTKSVKEVKEVNEDINIDMTDIKRDLTEYMEDKIDKEVAKSVEKSTKKLIRYKNSIIFRKNITIIILILICGFLGYSLYKISDIKVDINTGKNKTEKVEKVKKKEEKPKEDEQEKTKKEEEKYKKLIDDIYINDESIYAKDFYKGNLTDEVKQYIALNNLDEDKITYEDESTYIEADALKESYDNFFNDEFSPKTFEYNGLKIRYLNSKSLYIADGKIEKKKSNIEREVLNVEVDDEIKIKVVEGIVKNKKLYNITTEDEIKNYKEDSLKNHKKDLTVVTYTFQKEGDNNKLLSIEVE